MRPDAIAKAKSVARKVRAAKLAGHFLALCRNAGLPQPIREHRFHPTRLWRMDWAWPSKLVGLEVDGGIWLAGGGRHTRGAGWLKDTEKLNAAAALGYRMFRVTPQQLCTPDTIGMLKALLG